MTPYKVVRMNVYPYTYQRDVTVVGFQGAEINVIRSDREIDTRSGEETLMSRPPGSDSTNLTVYTEEQWRVLGAKPTNTPWRVTMEAENLHTGRIETWKTQSFGVPLPEGVSSDKLLSSAKEYSKRNKYRPLVENCHVGAEWIDTSSGVKPWPLSFSLQGCEGQYEACQ